MKRAMTLCLALVLVLSMTVTSSFAAGSGSSWSFKEPTAAMDITKNADGTKTVTMNAFRASIPIAALLGANLVAGGNITWQTYDNDGNVVGLYLMGSDVNENPDPYVWNFNYVATKFSYKNQIRSFAWLKSDGTEASSEEVYSVLPQSEFMYPILTYDANTHNMYASFGGNDTDSKAIAELGGVSTTMYMRPDLIMGNDGTAYADQIALINSWKEGDEFYQEGDENYNPTCIELGVGTLGQKIEGVVTVGSTLSQMVEDSNGTLSTRYGDAYTIATDYEKAIYGIYYYVMSNLKEYGGTLDKKDVAYVRQANDDGTYVVATTFSPSFQLLGTHTTNKVWGSITKEGGDDCATTEFTLTSAELADADFIYTTSAIKKKLLTQWESEGYKADDVPDVYEAMTLGVCNKAAEWACNVLTQEFPIVQLYAYKDELKEINEAADPMGMIAYIADNWYHISDEGSTLDNVVAKMVDIYLNPVNDLDKVVDKTDYVYDEDGINDMIEQGIDFATEHAADQTTWLDGSFNINDYIYKLAMGTTDVDTNRVTVTDEMLAAYKANMVPHPWQPDLTVGLGSGVDASDVFKDVPSGSWYEKAVTYALNNGIMKGMSEDTFSPQTETTRAQIAQILYNMEGASQTATGDVFKDVAKDKWYAPAIEWLQSTKIVSGYGDGNFGPEDAVTREQMAKILMEYTSYRGLDVAAGTAAYNKFDDAYKMSSWATIPVDWAVTTGVINGVKYGDTLKLEPQGKSTRAVIAQMMMNYCTTIK